MLCFASSSAHTPRPAIICFANLQWILTTMNLRFRQWASGWNLPLTNQPTSHWNFEMPLHRNISSIFLKWRFPRRDPSRAGQANCIKGSAKLLLLIGIGAIWPDRDRDRDRGWKNLIGMGSGIKKVDRGRSAGVCTLIRRGRVRFQCLPKVSNHTGLCRYMWADHASFLLRCTLQFK